MEDDHSTKRRRIQFWSEYEEKYVEVEEPDDEVEYLEQYYVANLAEEQEDRGGTAECHAKLSNLVNCEAR